MKYPTAEEVRGILEKFATGEHNEVLFKRFAHDLDWTIMVSPTVKNYGKNFMILRSMLLGKLPAVWTLQQQGRVSCPGVCSFASSYETTLKVDHCRFFLNLYYLSCWQKLTS